MIDFCRIDCDYRSGGDKVVRMTKVFTLLALIGLAVVGGTISPAQATLVIDNSGDNPVLLGATEVNVDGILYNVTFEDGTCAAVFGTCDENGFEFNDFNTARSAGQALLDQVFIDDPLLGLFDTRPELAFGCEDLGGSCITLIPYLIEAQRLFNIAVTNAGAFETADGLPPFFVPVAMLVLAR